MALLLDMRRQLTVVMDVLGGMLRGGITLSRSLELIVQWDCVLRAGPVHHVSLDFMAVPNDLRLHGALRREAVSDAWKQLRVLSPVRSTLLASLFQAEVWCSGGVRLSSGWLDLVDPRCARLVTTLLSC